MLRNWDGDLTMRRSVSSNATIDYTSGSLERTTRNLTSRSQRPRSFLEFLVVLAILFGAGHGQEQPKQIGVDLCACSPRTFEFTFDFTLTCPPVNVTAGGGVQSTSCLVAPYTEPDTTDLLPVLVTSIEITELGQDVGLLVRETLTANFTQGDSFTYESLVDTPELVSGPNDIPRVLQLNIVGLNQVNEDIINVVIITYSNNCVDFPVLFQGQSIGWIVLGPLGDAVQSLCTVNSGPTDSPTQAPTLSPAVATPAPVSPPTTAPDTPAPSPQTTATSAPVTSAPTSTPQAPSPDTPLPVAPTPETLTPGSPSPTDAVTPAPTFTPTQAPSPSPEVTIPPIPLPVRLPTTGAPTQEAPTDMMMSMDTKSFSRNLDELLDGAGFGRLLDDY